MLRDKSGNLLCDRCGKPMDRFTMSWFNSEEICSACRELERKHPNFEEAREYILKQEEQGNRNVIGIGLPTDLSIYKESSEDERVKTADNNQYDKEAFSSFQDYLNYVEGQKIK